MSTLESRPKAATARRTFTSPASGNFNARIGWHNLDMSHFDVNSVLRGIQLTLVGAHRALQNPSIFTNEHYRQAAYAVIAGIAIRLIVSVPILLVKAALWFLSIFISLDAVTWDDNLLNALDFIAEYVLQIPFFLMTLMRYVAPTLDNVFMQSLHWVDLTYTQKHRDEDPNRLRGMFYPNLALYSQPRRRSMGSSSNINLGWDSVSSFLYRFGRKGFVSLAVFTLSQLPVVGHVILPLASFYTFKRAVGMGPAALIFGVGLLLPRMYLVVFLQTYFSSRSLVRELLVPYFTRVPFTREQKKLWFRSREGVLFGFGLGFYILVRVPLFGVLIYGIAEASTAYLVTKITEPPPLPADFDAYAEEQLVWKNKHEFLDRSLWKLDDVLGE